MYIEEPIVNLAECEKVECEMRERVPGVSYKHKSGKEGWTPVKKKPQSDRAVETGSERAIHTDEQLNLMLGRSRLSWRIDKAI